MLRECPMTPLRLPSSAAAAACRLSDSGREHGFGAPRLPALRFVRTASGSERPRPRLQRHAPWLGGFIRYRGVPRSPHGHKNPRGSRLAVCSEEPPSNSMWPIVPSAGRLPARRRADRDSALDCALSSAHVGVSRPRCRWQPCGWRLHTTPSRKPHERSCQQSPCRHWPGGRFCRLSLPVLLIPHPVAGRVVTGGMRVSPGRDRRRLVRVRASASNASPAA